MKIKSFRYKWVSPSEGACNYVMVVLHGLGDSSQGYSWVPYEIPMNQTGYLLLNAPDPYYGGYSWFNFPEPMEPGILRSRNLLFALMEELQEAGFGPSQIYFFGFSQGCLMSLDLALHYPAPLGGICGVSGYLGLEHEYPLGLSPFASQQKILLTHGLADPLIPEAASALQYKKLSSWGVPLEYKTYSKVHTLIPEEIEYIHQWFIKIRQGN